MRKSCQSTGYKPDDAEALHSCCVRCWEHHSWGLWENRLHLKGGDERGGGVRKAGKKPSFSPIKILPWLEHGMQLPYLAYALEPWRAEACLRGRACSSLFGRCCLLHTDILLCVMLLTFPRSVTSLALTLLPFPSLALDGARLCFHWWFPFTLKLQEFLLVVAFFTNTGLLEGQSLA